MRDVIERQAAIAEIKRWTGYIDEDMVYRIQTGLKKIPSAEPEYDLDGYSSRLWKAAYERGKQDAEPEPQWMPCSERLPEVRQWVLCHCRAGIMDVLRLTNDGSWNKNYPHVDYMSGFVLAWMRLPEPYRKTEMGTNHEDA